MHDKQENPYSYLSYVTLREMWAETKGYFWIWLIFSVIAVAIGALVDFGASATREFFDGAGSSILPKWTWPVVIFSAVVWFWKGEEIKFRFPNLTFTSWLIVTVVMGLLAFVFENFSFWVAGPFYFAVFIGLAALDTLAAKGKDNYLKLKGDD